MTRQHRGHTIEVGRELTMSGDELLYFSIFRDVDGYECVASFEDSLETVEDKVDQLVERIDAELLEEDPWGEAAAER